MNWTDAVAKSKTGFAFRINGYNKELRIINSLGEVFIIDNEEIMRKMKFPNAKKYKDFEPINGKTKGIPNEILKRIGIGILESKPKSIGLKCLIVQAGEHVNVIREIADSMFTYKDFTNPEFGDRLDELIQHAILLKKIL